MNILPLIFAFLLIAAFVSATMSRSLLGTSQNLALWKGLMKADADVRTLKARKAHKFAAAKAAASKEEKEEEQQQSKDGVYFRLRRPKYDSNRLNIAALRKDPHNNNFLYEGAAKLLRSLYAKHAFWQEGAEYRFLDMLIQRPSSELSELFAPHDPMYTIIYMMVRGSNTYDLLGKRGIPPLREFFSLEGAREPICFPMAHAFVLAAFLPPDVLQALERREKSSGKQPLAREAFEQLLRDQHAALPERLFLFTRPSKEPLLVIRDEASGVGVWASAQ